MTPPRILQVHRDILKPGSAVEYAENEAEIARINRALGCPHPYLAIEALAGSTEVWFFNGYASPAEVKQVADAYAKNAPLMAALRPRGQRKPSLILEAVSLFAEYRQDLSGGAPWTLGVGRFLAITRTTGGRRGAGTVFEAPDGTRFVVTPAETRDDADAGAASAGPESRSFAVRPQWSFPAPEWIDVDPDFWRGAPPQRLTPREK